MVDILRVGSLDLDPMLMLLALAGLAVVALLALVIVSALNMSRRRREASAQDAQLAELKVRLQAFAESSVSRHGDLARAVNERLDRVSQRLGTDMTETTR
jgi:DNA recombination protein RmuC